MNVAVVRERLVRFFQEHNPERLQLIDDIIAKYHDEPEQLFADLESKYGIPVPEVDEKDLPYLSSKNNNQQNDDEDNDSITHHDKDSNTGDPPYAMDNNNDNIDGNGGGTSSKTNLTMENLHNSNNSNHRLGSNNSKNNNNNNQEDQSYHSGASHPMNQERLQQRNDDNNNNNNTANDDESRKRLASSSENLLKYAEPDAEVLAQLDDWDFNGLPDVDPRFGLQFYVAPDFGAKQVVKVDSAAAFGNHAHHKNNTTTDDKKETKEKKDNDNSSNINPNMPAYFRHFDNLITNHAMYWFCIVKKYSDSLFTKVAADQRVLFVTDRCVFIAKPTAEAEITRILHIDEIACLFVNYEFVEQNIIGGANNNNNNNNNNPATSATTTNTNTLSSEENFVVFKMIPGIDQDEEDLESGCYDLYVSFPTVAVTKAFIHVLSVLYRCNPLVQRRHSKQGGGGGGASRNQNNSNNSNSTLFSSLANLQQQNNRSEELLVTPINAKSPLANNVIHLNLKRPGYLANRLATIAPEIQPKTRTKVLKELKEFAEDNNIIYSKSGKIKEAPKAFLLDADGRPSLLTRRKSGVVVPITGLKTVLKDEKKRQKTQSRSEALDIMKRANRNIQNDMLHDPHRCVMNDPSDILAYRNQKAMQADRAAAVSRVTSEFAARSHYIQEHSPARGFLLKMMEQQQNDINSSHFQHLSPINKNNNNTSNNRSRPDADNTDGDIVAASIPSPARLQQLRESQLLNMVAPSLCDSWKVLQDSAPTPVSGYVGDSINSSASLEKKNILRKLGSSNAIVVDANKKHQEVMISPSSDKNKKKDGAPPGATSGLVTSPTKLWGRTSQQQQSHNNNDIPHHQEVQNKSNNSGNPVNNNLGLTFSEHRSHQSGKSGNDNNNSNNKPPSHHSYHSQPQQQQPSPKQPLSHTSQRSNNNNNNDQDGVKSNESFHLGS